MICNGLEKERTFSRMVNFPTYIMCGSGHVVGKRLIEYTPFNDVNNNKVALLVECGQHGAKATGMAALDTALHFLRSANTVSPTFIEEHLSDAAANPPGHKCGTSQRLIAETDDFEFVEPFAGMEIIETAETVIAMMGIHRLSPLR
ncbi:MAG: hypothetical protein CM1200mP41_31350 [Gammaproteobacteria bacterium]|nr:MAG: hypothetical protein CM1200mP41_31350 [Gammaproteobacteria bacterium]